MLVRVNLMHTIKFYPVGNGDTSQIILSNGRRLLFDFRHIARSEDDDMPEWDLKKKLKQELDDAKRDYFDVVAFTHGDQDHISNSTTFFELRHAKKYQGKDRIKIETLWVPAAMIIETAESDEQSDEFVVWRQEARHRLLEGKGIQVFSRPDCLKDWLAENGKTVKEVEHCITDAGQLAKGFNTKDDDVEFFCHSPFVKHTDDGDDLRNGAALIFNVRFGEGSAATDYFATGDSKYEVLEDIVEISKAHGNDDRLAWDIFALPHHCSYLTLGPEKGDTETTPTKLVEELLLSGKEGNFVVSSSQPIRDSKEAHKQALPPHIQAKRCYETYRKKVKGRSFLVTMEEPNERKPQPIVFRIGDEGLSLESAGKSATFTVATTRAPKAGEDDRLP